MSVVALLEGESDSSEWGVGGEATVAGEVTLRLADLDDEKHPDDVAVLVPRSRNAFYGGVCAGCKLWERPPDDHCARCAKYDDFARDIDELSGALYSSRVRGDAAREASPVVVAAGGLLAARERLRKLQHQHADLEKHVLWRKTQRVFIAAKRRRMPANTCALLYLDYGSMNDSANKKVSCWSCTIVTTGNDDQHVDIFFDAMNQNGVADGWKKDGTAGVFCLNELLREQTDHPQRKSMLLQLFPSLELVLLSGDTGNGFRAYEMLDSLSLVWQLCAPTPTHTH